MTPQQAWLRLLYPGEIAGGTSGANPEEAVRMLEEDPGLPGSDPHLACAIGDTEAMRAEIARDRDWLDRPGGPLAVPPLIAVTHSSLIRRDRYRARMLASAGILLEAGADPNPAIDSRWTPPSSEPSGPFPLSALYGAAGLNRDPEMTALLLAHGADPNDGESLYHSLENPACTQLLLEAGARIAGTNALYRALDLPDAEPLRLLLAHGADPNEPASHPPIDAFGAPLLWAIRRRCSPVHVNALLEAGADASARTPDGIDAVTLARRYGLMQAAALLSDRSAPDTPSDEEQFLAACASGDEAQARVIQARRPDLPGSLSESGLRMLPELAALGCGEAVRLMAELGWPIAVPGGDWDASALNHAVFRGDASLTGFLLDKGASWRERHGFGDDVSGTLAWASLNHPDGPGDWPGCAKVLAVHGMPIASPANGAAIFVNGQPKTFSEDVSAALLSAKMLP